MNLSQLKSALSEHLYMEDTGIVDITLASTIANTLHLGQPVWMVIIGPPSGGKTQFILPLQHTSKTIHQITDLTPNTFLSGFRAGTSEPSLLKRIGEDGILLFPDLTSLFSKDETTQAEILGQMRHIYDGYLTKMTGNQEPIVWEGRMGVIGASTPSIYRHFEHIADMGERFMYYRLKPYNVDKATDKALSRSLYGKDLDQHIGKLYSTYLSTVIKGQKDTKLVIDEKSSERIKNMALYASLFRTSVHMNLRNGEVDRIPEPEMPMRTALQLRGIALGLLAMNKVEGIDNLTEENMHLLEWCAYSLANDERRNALRALAQYTDGCKTSGIATTMNLPTESAKTYLQQLNALKVCTREKEGTNDKWQMTNTKMRRFILRVEKVKEVKGELFTAPEDEPLDDGRWAQPDLDV